ncbi:MAG: OmpA family protein [Saprospiraceae bacterium]|jgi:peptidoglycan-associated lipoprotein|nr:OmpA family protein [Saprospiraceae bacterium]MCO5278681.1 OmpA family protein [Saprospiraceae bacterium]
MKILNAILALLLVMLSGSVFAQPLTSIPFQAHIEKAEEYAETNNLASQLDQLEEAYKKNRDKSMLPLMAELNYKLRDYGKAENLYKRIVDSDKKGTNIEALYMYGKMLKLNGKYAEAAEVFRKIKDGDNDTYANLSILELKGILLAVSSDSTNVTVSSAGPKVNTKSGEYSPFLMENELYFTSSALESGAEPGKDYGVKLLRSQKDKDGGWGKSTEADALITASSPAIGNVAFSVRDQTMFLTKVTFHGEELKTSRVYYSIREGNAWTDPAIVQGLPDSFIVKNPMPGELYGRDVLFFSTDAPGGKGGFDIFYATKISTGVYDSPVNLGSMVNTAGNEITPFYRDGKLIFATDGLPSFGGYDLYSTEWNGTSWSTPVNMGPGYNSSADDMYYMVDDEGYEGLLVSNRVGTTSLRGKTCCDDIFTFSIAKPVVSLDIYVLDENKPLRQGEVTIMEQFKPETKLTEGKDDNYNFAYDLDINKGYFVKVTRIGYFPDSAYIKTLDIKADTTVTLKINLKPKPEIEVVSINQAIRLNNIYYNYNDAKILKAARPDLDYLYELMQQYPDMVIELSSHTDARGNDEFNQKLSQRRADSAKKYLVDKGVPDERIKAVGYGETQLLNKCGNDVKCTEEEHQLNRRTEFKIIAGPTNIEIKKQITKERGKVIETKTIKGK